MPKSLIITADDYGMTEGINRGIDACVDAGVIQSVCVMPNMAFWKDVAALARRHPDVSVGIHWTVTQGRPVLAARDVPSLVDPGGEFLPPKAFRARFRRGGLVIRELAAELEAQVRRLREAAPRVAFWNTHQNIHVTWGLYRQFSRIAKGLGISGMRSHRRLMAAGGRPMLGFYLRHPVFWLKGLLLSRWASDAARDGLNLPVGRVVQADAGSGNGDLLAALRGTEWGGAAELVTHPASSTDGLLGMTTIVESRVAEFRQFSAPDFRARIAALGIDLASFAAVTEKPFNAARES